MTLGPEETNSGEVALQKDAQPGSTKARDVRRLCAGLLAEVAATFETEQAVLYAAADRDRLVFVVESAGEWAEAITHPRHEHQSYRDKRVDASAMQALGPPRDSSPTASIAARVILSLSRASSTARW